jgi:hypothetical protein
MTAPVSDEREIGALTGQISQYIYDEFCQAFPPFRFGDEKFHNAYMEELPDEKLDDNDLIIVRESDNQFFLVEIEVFVRKIDTPAVTS